MFLVFWFAKIVKHLAETSHGLKRGQAVLISLQSDPDAIGGKTLHRSVLSGEGHGSGENGARLRAR